MQKLPTGSILFHQGRITSLQVFSLNQQNFKYKRKTLILHVLWKSTKVKCWCVDVKKVTSSFLIVVYSALLHRMELIKFWTGTLMYASKEYILLLIQNVYLLLGVDATAAMPFHSLSSHLNRNKIIVFQYSWCKCKEFWL